MITKDITLDWLAKFYGKGMPMPKLRMLEGGYGGLTCYLPPCDCRIPLKAGWFRRATEKIGRTGMIVINLTDYVEERLRAGGGGHEWRHHMQHFTGVSNLEHSRLASRLALSVLTGRSDVNERAFLRKYYSIPTERDALEFECKLIGHPARVKVLESLPPI